MDRSVHEEDDAMPMLEMLGWRDSHQICLQELGDSTLLPARVSALMGPTVTLFGLSPEDPMRPEMVSDVGKDLALAVGDWVACRRRGDLWTIAAILPRSSCFMRKAAGRSSASQLVAANVDRVLVVTAVGSDLSPRRLERYLAAIWSGGAEPVIVVNKTDREHDAEALARELSVVSAGAKVVHISALHDRDLSALQSSLLPGSTVAVVGSSGVGKSTLINRLLGSQHFATSDVRQHDDTGQHTTTHRELVRAESGVLLIDTPGMRELGLLDADAGMEIAFADVETLARRCRFGDCRHDSEPGCAVRAAIQQGVLPEARLISYLSLRSEVEHNAQRAEERSAHDTKGRWKVVHKSARERRKLHQKLGLKDD